MDAGRTREVLAAIGAVTAGAVIALIYMYAVGLALSWR